MNTGERIAADLAALPLHSAVFASNINFFTRSCPPISPYFPYPYFLFLSPYFRPVI
jgi:hypothetical protein